MLDAAVPVSVAARATVVLGLVVLLADVAREFIDCDGTAERVAEVSRLEVSRAELFMEFVALRETLSDVFCDVALRDTDVCVVVSFCLVTELLSRTAASAKPIPTKAHKLNTSIFFTRPSL
jgi:hypothetical protein